jgi:amino acid adenylation domain-containing protein
MTQKTKLLLPNQAALLQRLLGDAPGRSKRIVPQPRAPHGSKLRAPASAAQRRLWFIDRLGDGLQAAYHIPISVRLTGALEGAALRSAVADLSLRHEILRTSFIDEGGGLKQEIAPEPSFELTTIDLSDLDAARRKDAIAKNRFDEVTTPFDLAKGPLFRGRLLKCSADEHFLLITMHHIIFDGWSTDIFIRELLRFYTAQVEGVTAALDPLPIQYADYAKWHLQTLHQPDRLQQIEYWRNQLAGAPPRLELPTDRPRTNQQGHRSGSVAVTLEPSLAREVRAFAQREGMTLFTVLYAGWAVLMARLSAQEDVVVGTPVAGRPRVELEGLVGLFVNSLALRLEFSFSDPVSQLWAKVRQVVVDAFDNQDAAFDQVVEALQPERELGVNPIFQTMFAFREGTLSEYQSPNLTATIQDDTANHSMFDLLLMLNETDQGISGSIDYRLDIFDGATVECWAACFCMLLRAMISEPDVPVARLPMLTVDERARILETWNDTDGLFPETVLIHQLFQQRAAELPQAVAVVYDGDSLTYGDLNRRANRLARHLRGCGVRNGSVVGICAERGFHLVEGLLAILKAGAAYVPLDPNYPVDRLARILDDSSPALVLTQGIARTVLRDSLAASSQALATIDLADDADRWAHHDDHDLEIAEATSQDPAYFIYTSGSTGQPKGIVVQHAPAVNLLNWVNRTFEVGPGDTLLFVTSICFDLSVYDVFGILAAGATIHVVRDGLLSEPARLAELLYSGDITFWDSAPAALQLVTPFLTKKASSLSRLRLIFNSGDWIPLALPCAIRAVFPQARFISLGGATEATIWSNWHEVAAVDPGWRSIPYGRPIDNARYYILDRFMEPLPCGVPGELYIGGKCLARGYTREDLTVERFVPSPFVEGERLYCSGDRARYFADGTIEFLGRTDTQVKIRGYRVELGEIEAQLLSRDDLRDATVVVREDVPGDKRLVAYYTCSQKIGPTPEVLRQHLADRLPAYMVPAAYVALPALPVTANGKLDRRALPLPEADAYGEVVYQPPRDHWEAGLVSIWQELLNFERIGRADNFFNLGGHSLLGVQLVAKIKERFEVSFPIVAIFRNPSIREMASAIRSLEAQTRTRAVHLPGLAPRSPAALAPLSFAQLYRWYSMLPEERELRQMTRATRIVGQLKPEFLRRSVARVVERHEALRTLFELIDGVPKQRIVASSSDLLVMHDLRDVSPSIQADTLQNTIHSFLAERVDIAIDQPFKAILLRLDDDVYVFVAVMHLLIADGYSMNVLMRDILGTYAKWVEGCAAEQDPLPIQMADFAVWQQASASMWSAQHLDYWTGRLNGCPRLRFPDVGVVGSPVRRGGATLPIHIDANRTAKLREWCRCRQTTLVMGVFAIYAAVLLRWCGSSDAVVRYQSNGRNDPLLNDSIGVFASTLNLRITITPDDTFESFLRSVVAEYCNAVEHSDLSYIDSIIPKLPYVHNSTFNWIPIGEKNRSLSMAGGQSGIDTSLHSFTTPDKLLFDTEDEPLILLSDTDAGIIGEVFYSQSRLSRDNMSTFIECLTSTIDLLLSQPARRVLEIIPNQ